MAEDSDSSADKSEEPTPKRLEKAREDGNIARSRELNTAAILITGAVGLLGFGPYIALNLSNIMSFNFAIPARIADDGLLLDHLNQSIMQALLGLVPLFLILLIAAIIGPTMLGGFNFSFKAISPKASRMNPMSGLARMFGPKALLELAKAVAKVLVVGSIAALVVYANTDDLLSLQEQATLPAMIHSLQIIGWGFLMMASAMLIITAIDVPIQVTQHLEKLRMTLQQVKDEMKETDGRPEVKQKIRQLQQQMASNRMMQDLPLADVVITNPDHYAVALRYDQHQEGAPRLLAKGVDHLAFRIKEVAEENGIPIVSSPPLARAIYFNTPIGDEIPAGLYVAVAQVLAYIYQLRQFAKGKAKRPKLNKNPEIPPELRRD